MEHHVDRAGPQKTSAMSAFVARSTRLYRRGISKCGPFEPIAHAAFVTYTVLLLTAALVNLVAPSFASRNAAVVQRTTSVPPVESLSHSALSVGRCLSKGLLEGDEQNAVIRRLTAEFDCGCKVPAVYEAHETPTVCAVLQSYNHAANIPRIAAALKANPAIQEVIVCEDGSIDGSLAAWADALKETKHFIVRSNNLHETRCYNRAMRMSSAEYFILMQDDDLPPVPAATSENADAPSPNWVSEALELFDADPKLGVLSGYIGQLWEAGAGYEFGEQTSSHGGTRKGPTRRIPFLSKRTYKPFMYVECGWIAPLIIRSKALHRIGGLDIGLFKVGEPGVWQDCVISYAAWTAGWRVGVYNAEFQRGVGGHGSASSPRKIKMRNTVWQKAKDAVDSRYDRNYIRERVLDLNEATLTPRYANVTE